MPGQLAQSQETLYVRAHLCIHWPGGSLRVGDGLRRLRSQTQTATPERAAKNLEGGLERGDVLLAADAGAENAACGFAWCAPQGGFGRSLYIRWFGVRKELARAGVGAALIRSVEEAALKISRELFLLVSDFNTDAQRFYQRQGYQQIGAIPGYVLPDVTELLYWKQLQPTSAIT